MGFCERNINLRLRLLMPDLKYALKIFSHDETKGKNI